MSTCNGCGAAIDWRINPSGKREPVNPDGTSHFITCPYALYFKGRHVPAPLMERWHERAAILEFDGGLSREEADARAWKEIEPLLPPPRSVAPAPAAIPITQLKKEAPPPQLSLC